MVGLGTYNRVDLVMIRDGSVVRGSMLFCKRGWYGTGKRQTIMAI